MLLVFPFEHRGFMIMGCPATIMISVAFLMLSSNLLVVSESILLQNHRHPNQEGAFTYDNIRYGIHSTDYTM